MIRVGIIGASGYSGSVAAALVCAHPELTLTASTSEKWVGRALRDELGIASPLRFLPHSEAPGLATQCDVVLAATSAEVSAALVPPLLQAGCSVIDLSGAFRLPDVADYLTYYKLAHPRPDLLSLSRYGLPELFAPPAEGYQGASPFLVANPGCYATATLLSLGPLVRCDVIESAPIFVDGKSGVSGAGRQSSERYSYTETADDVRAYKLLAHQHTPEIRRYLALYGRRPSVDLTFTAHLVPARRGLLVTSYFQVRAGVDAAAMRRIMEETYAGCPFVRVVEPEEVTLHRAAGTNVAYVSATTDGHVGVALGSLDNLLKGAAGQAVQNLNLAMGLPATTGLDSLLRFAP